MKFVGSFSICLLLGFALWMHFSTPERIIYIYDDYFEPSQLEISVGETVRFQSMTDRETWPASNAHPSHGIYPEFDPKEPIEGDGEWKFTFDRAGIWEFHDHLRSGMKGTVVVIGEFGEAALGCVETKTGVIRATCWENDFKILIEEEGFDAAFAKFIDFYEKDASFRSYCHDIMHYVGRAAYDVYQLDNSIIDREELSYCGYGFYHGFIEASLESEGAEGLEVVKAYCEEVYERDERARGYNSSWKAGACWHGIGHAVFDSLDGSLWGDPMRMTDSALRICESVFENLVMRLQCATGVFNSLATAMTSYFYNLEKDFSRTNEICKAQDEVYADACYLDLVVGHVNSSDLTLEDGIDYTLNLEDVSSSSIAHALFGVVDDTFRRDPTAEPDISLYTNTCLSLEDKQYIQSCIEGVIVGIINSSHSNNVDDRLGDFCSRLPSEFYSPNCIVLERKVTELQM